jgi:hypothetical protein
METQKVSMIVWNGCDSYVELDAAESRGHDVRGNSLFTQREEFKAFPAVEIDFDSLPMIDGERDTDGVLGSESGKFYRAS